jgi:hypothetical protein
MKKSWHVDGFPCQSASQAFPHHLRVLTIIITIIFIRFSLRFILDRGTSLVLSIRSRHRFSFPSHHPPFPSFPSPNGRGWAVGRCPTTVNGLKF